MSGNPRGPVVPPLPVALGSVSPETAAERIRARLARVPRGHPTRRMLLDWLEALQAQMQERSAMEQGTESGVVIDTEEPAPATPEGTTRRRRKFRRRRVHSVDVVDDEVPEGP